MNRIGSLHGKLLGNNGFAKPQINLFAFFKDNGANFPDYLFKDLVARKVFDVFTHKWKWEVKIPKNNH